MARDEAAAKELREQFEHDDAEWADIRKARASDIRALSEDSTWDDEDRKAREEAKRPCLSFDELNQYVNQLNNDVRATKRAIEVNPEGDESTDAQARFVANLIRQIEYRSNAQQGYEQMAEDCFEGSYGFLRVNTRYVQDKVDEPSARSFDQEIVIEGIHNPEHVTPGYAVKPDLSDMKRCWVREPWAHDEFKDSFPDAEIRDFGGDAIREAGPRWLDAQTVVVCEKWAIKTKPRKLLLVDVGQPEPVAFWKDTVEKGKLSTLKILRERTVENPYVCQQLTNGLEILDTIEWPGKYIPIIGCLGKISWVDTGAGSKRRIRSLIRNAKGPQQLYNYYGSTEAEVIGMTPKFPYFVVKGSLDPTNALALAKSTREPVAYVEVETPENAAPGAPPPFPQRQSYEPPIQAFSIGREEARRAIQAATGTGFLPTQAQRKNEKSGVALRRIESSAQKGAFHFIDHYEDALRHCGVVIVDLIPHIYDTARDLVVRKPDDKPITVRINDPEGEPHQEYGEPIMLSKASLGVRLSTGPSYESERDAASDFADQLIGVRPEVFQIIGDLAIKLKNLGPLGDEMAKRFEMMLPPQIQQAKNGKQPLPPEAQAQLAQAQTMVQQAMAKVQELQQIVETDQVKAQAALAKSEADNAAKLQKTEADNATKLQLEQIKADLAVLLQEMKNRQQDRDREDTQKHELGVKGADAAHADQQAERAALMSLASGPLDTGGESFSNNDDESDGA